MEMKDFEKDNEQAKEKLNKSSSKDVEKDHLDIVISHMGEMGRYQKFLFMTMLPFGVFFTFIYFIQMFITATPQSHWCSVPELQHLDAEVRRNLSVPQTDQGGWEQCVMYSANWSEVLLSMKPPLPGTPTVPCDNGWEFQYKDIPYHTVVSERGWVCDYASYIPLAQALFFAGSLIGGTALGWVADYHGRIPALVASNLLGCLGGVASVYTTRFWDFAASRFIVGMSYNSCFMILYILVLEYVGPRYRTYVANFSFALFFGGGCLVLPWLALWIGDWRQLLLWTSLPMLIVLVAPFIMPESARWLASKGRVNQAVNVLRRFEKVNGKKIPQHVLDEFIVSASQTKTTDESIGSLFRSPPLRLMMLYLVSAVMCSAMVFDGLVRISEKLGYDFFITFTFTSATEIPSLIIVGLVLDRWGRRPLMCIPMFISGVLTLIAAFVPKGIPQVVLAIPARFFINMSCNALIQWSTELLPTPVRASGTAVITSAGCIAALLSPFIVYSERFWTPLPLLVMGTMAVFATGIGALLPETVGRAMPQTIAEGEALVRTYAFCGKTEEDKDEEIAKQKPLLT